jgi:Zn-dependent protease with chaperone function
MESVSGSSQFFDSQHLDASASNHVESDQSQHPSLKAGLAALKAQDYELAIALLESVYQSAPDRTSRVKAQIGLVKAYERVGNFKWAIALCQPLCEESNHQVKQWASQTLEELNDRFLSTERDILPASPASDPTALDPIDLTGFIPLSSSLPQPDAQGSQERAIAADETGFVALTQSPQVKPGETTTAWETSDSVASPTQSTSQGTEISTTIPYEESVAEPVPEQPLEVEQNARVHNPTDRTGQPDKTGQPSAAGSLTWRQAGRAQKWSPLRITDTATLWIAQIWTAIALVFILWAVLKLFMGTVNWIAFHILWPLGIRSYGIQGNPTPAIVVGLVLLFFLSPWILDQVLRQVYGAKSLSLDMLSRYSPEATRMLRRVSSQRRYPLPQLSILYATSPVIMTYGTLRRHARITISQGLLDQLADDEIAALYAGEIGHLAHWDFSILSLVTLVTQIPYLGYWQLSTWGDSVAANGSPKRWYNQGLQWIAVGLSTLSYGLYRSLRWAGLWLSRLRVNYSDRTASEITGNPNGLIRALLKTTVGIAQDIRRQGHTSPLLESFDLLAPVSCRIAVTLGTACFHAPWEALLEWERQNPYRRWLAVNNANPPIGDRLQLLLSYARHWRLETELDLPGKPQPVQLPLRRFLLQVAPFLGALVGVAIAICLWLVGALAIQLNRLALGWMWGDWSLIWGFLWLGFSVGMFLRINPFFPDIKPTNLQTDPSLPQLLMHPAGLPLDSQAVQLQGRLLGGRGLGNLLNQDLLLQSNTGLIKLHYVTQLGPVGNLMPQSHHPHHLINNPVTITGWFRRGATPWIDVDAIQPQRGIALRSGHPIWSTVVAALATCWGLYIIFRGG